MEIKKIKLSIKKGGNGYASSYSVNIGSSEAQICGLISTTEPVLLCKVVDNENGQIIIKPKRYTLTEDVTQKVILAATQYREIAEAETKSESLVIRGIIDITDIQKPDESVRKAEAELEKMLMDLSYEEITDLVTLMLMGRDNDADMTLESTKRFLDYWRYLLDQGVFHDKERLIDYMVEKIPLCEYLQRGLEILKKPVQVQAEPTDFDEW